MVDQKIIDEAKAMGIVPGARIQCAYGSGNGTVSPYDKWLMVGKSLWCGRDDDGCSLEAYNSRNDRWATVLTPAPQAASEGLAEGDACECSDAMRAAIIELAKELGIWHADGLDQHGDDEVVGLWFVTDVKRVYWSCKMWPSNVLHTPEAFIAKMRVTAAKPKPIRIGDYEVKFNAGSIKVGCTTIDNATVRAIAANLKD